MIKQTWKKADYKTKVRKWKQTTERLERPSRLARARALGYRAKQGYVVVRARIGKGGRKRPNPKKGRKPAKKAIYFNPKLSLRAIAEKRSARKYPNLEVLNSYFVGKSGTHNFYEVIMVDPHSPSVKNDKKINWIVNHRRRAFRGLTAAGRRSRGL